jgi:hypothetical protein
MDVVLASSSTAVFHFHPQCEDLSVGTPELKKSVECEVPVCSNSEIAVLRGR